MKATNLCRTSVMILTGLTLLGPAAVQALDVSEYGVLKGKEYTQEDASTPPDGEWSLYWLSAYTRMTVADSVTEATVQPPGGEAIPLYVPEDPLLLQLNLPGGFNASEMNTAYPNGDYLLALTTVHDGTKNISLSVTGDAYPNTPTFLDFAALDAVNPAAAFPVSWSALTGGTANDYIQVRVVDPDGNVMFITPEAGVAGALSGTATTVVIPASTLQPESNYTIRLLFVKVTTRDTTSYPGLTGLGGYYKHTDAYLTTTAGGGGGDTTPPELVFSNPATGATGVATTSPIVFVFDEPMAASQSIAWSANLNAAQFLHAWSGDGRTLSCTYVGGLPPMSQITWALNPSGQPQGFKDTAGNPLPEDTYAGTFATAAGTNNPCEPVDDGRGYGGTTKELTYVQTSAAAPTADLERPATFLGSVTSPTNNVVTSAQLQVPGGPLLTLTNFFGLGRAFVAIEDYASQSALDAARPAGNYNLQLTRTSGSPSANVNLGASYPPTPQIENHAECQAVNPSASFTVQWNGFTGATANDSIGFSLVHPDPFNFWQWVAPDPCVPRELANSAMSVTIPAGTLQPGVTYEASLIYSRMTDGKTNTIADITLAAFLQKTLNFTLKTTGGGGGGARFIGFTVLPGGMLELKLQGTGGESFVIETSDNLLGGWTGVSMQIIPAGGIATFQVAAGEESGFFRARKP